MTNLDATSASVQNAVETLYKQLQNGTTTIELKKGHRDISSAFLAAIVDIVLVNTTTESSSSQESINGKL